MKALTPAVRPCSFCGRGIKCDHVTLDSGRVAWLCVESSIPCGKDYHMRRFADRELAKQEAAEAADGANK